MFVILLFNIKLPINFNSPYKATDIQDFWKRWHITLSRFLKDYVYIPLGGNRKGELRTYNNLLATFIIGGIWCRDAWYLDSVRMRTWTAEESTLGQGTHGLCGQF